MSDVVALDHTKFKHVATDVFTKRVTSDCMTHQCAMHATKTEKLEACCQYGCDVDMFEMHAIIAHAEDIAQTLHPDVPNKWFDDEKPEPDPDSRSGLLVRTMTHNGGCIFLSHDQRGCGIHRTALEKGWDWRDVKPSICQLFPLSYTSDTITVCDDFADYSCAYLDDDVPTLYQVSREALRHVFGESLVAAMDEAEARVKARRLTVVK